MTHDQLTHFHLCLPQQAAAGTADRRFPRIASSLKITQCKHNYLQNRTVVQWPLRHWAYFWRSCSCKRYQLGSNLRLAGIHFADSTQHETRHAPGLQDVGRASTIPSRRAVVRLRKSKRKLRYREDGRAMRPTWVPWKFRNSLTTPTAIFPYFFMDFWSHRPCP